jgi:transposase
MVETGLVKQRKNDSIVGMNRQDFLGHASRRDLIESARARSGTKRLSRHATALAPLDLGLNLASAAKVQLLHEDTIGTWNSLYEEDNARYNHPKLVQTLLAQSECRIKLYFNPAYCRHIIPIERLWRLMHRHITHNKSYASFRDFCIAMLDFLRSEAPKNWNTWAGAIKDNFQIIIPTKY